MPAVKFIERLDSEQVSEDSGIYSFRMDTNEREIGDFGG